MTYSPHAISKLIAYGVYANEHHYGFCKPVTQQQQNWFAAEMQNDTTLYNCLCAVKFNTDDDIGVVFSKLHALASYDTAQKIALHSYPFKNALIPHFELFSYLTQKIDDLISFLIEKDTQHAIKSRLLKNQIVLYLKESYKKEMVIVMPNHCTFNIALIQTWAAEYAELFEQETAANIRQKLICITELSTLIDYITNADEFIHWANSIASDSPVQMQFLDILFKIQHAKQSKLDGLTEILTLFDSLELKKLA